MYEQNARQSIDPGALTDIMTALLTLEYCQSNEIPLETEVTAQSYLFDEFAGLGVTTADVRAGRRCASSTFVRPDFAVRM